jgi:hypothetical protein
MLRSFFTCMLFSFSVTLFAQEASPAEIKAKKIKKQTVTTKSTEADQVTVTYYDDKGNDTANYNNGVRSYYKVIQYNSKGKIDKFTNYADDGRETDATVYTYNADGSAVAVNKDAQFGLAYHYTYDKNGNKTSFKIPDGTVIKYFYNSKNQLIKTQSFPAADDDVKYVIAHTYNAKNKMIKSVQTGDNNNTTTYEYAADGLLKKATIKGSGYTTTYTYEYGY